MQKTAISNHTQSADTQSPTLDLNEKIKWAQRKMLIIAVNSKIQSIFQKPDSDYLELFSEMGTFQSLQQQTGLGVIEEEIKKKFFSKHYEQILVHFFQYLFDFDIQTLQFTQKHQTILSFAQWIESQVVFEIPDGIRLLNIKKSQVQTLPTQKQNAQKNKLTQESLKVQSSKRNFNDEEKKQKQSQYSSHPNKKIVVQDEQKRVKLINKKSNDPKINQESQIIKQIERYRIHGSLIVDQEFAARQIKKVNGAKKPKSQLPQNESKKTKKSRQASRPQESKNIVFASKNQEKKNHHYMKKIAVIQELENVPIIILDTSQQKSKQKIFEEQKTNKLISSSNGKDSEKISQTSSLMNNSNAKRDTGQEFLWNMESQPKGENDAILRPSILSADLIMEQIIDKHREQASRQPHKDLRRRLHQFRTKISCLLKYSEKRFYIFPDFAPDLDDTDSNDKDQTQQSPPKRNHKPKNPQSN